MNPLRQTNRGGAGPVGLFPPSPFGNPSNWTTKTLRVQESNTTDTLATVSSFTTPLAASKRYWFRGQWLIAYGNTDAFKFRFDGPAGVALGYAINSFKPTTNGGNIAPVEIVLVPTTLFVSVAVGGGYTALMDFAGFINTGVTAGNFIAQFAKNTTGGGETAFLRSGSYIEISTQPYI